MRTSLNLRSRVGAAFGALVSFTLTCQAAEEWSPLFNGNNLDGWIQRGGQAKYAIEGNEIVGTSVTNTPNSFLCTAKEYGDFILEYDFKVDPRLNSGVQIRSECFDTPKRIVWQGKTINIPAGRVHGYQVEIDPDVPRKRMWSGGIYDEARRMWLFPSDGETGLQGKSFSELGIGIFKAQDWNHVRVEAIGDSIRTSLNGTPCASISDFLTPRGFIALQVHSIGNEKDKIGTQVRWRNLRIQEIAPNTLTAAQEGLGWRLLWNGKTTDGWRSARSDSFPAKGWEIKDGVLTVLASGSGEAGGGGDIISRERYANFELMFEFKLTEGANSGMKYFYQPDLALGLEYQVLDDERHPDAKAGRDGNRTEGSLYDLLPASTNKQANVIGEWNFARVLSRGNHVEHWLNGLKVLEYERGSPRYREAVAQSKFKNTRNFGEWADGHILLQEHGNRVSYRNLKIRKVPVD